jgi:hypothetical protein
MVPDFHHLIILVPIYYLQEQGTIYILGKSFPHGNVEYTLAINYVASRKVGRSRPDEVDFFLSYLILPAALWPWDRLSL